MFHIVMTSSREVVEDARNASFRDFIVNVKDVFNRKKSFIHVAMIMTNVFGNSKEKPPASENEKPKLLQTLEKMLRSLFKYSTGTPLHFIVFTDEPSRKSITKTLKDEIGRYLSETAILNHYVTKVHRAYKMPRLMVEYVDLQAMANKYREDIDEIKKHYGHHFPEGTIFMPEDGKGPVMVPNFKYTLDLFYLVPFYHREFPEEIEKLIVLDIDLEFR